MSEKTTEESTQESTGTSRRGTSRSPSTQKSSTSKASSAKASSVKQSSAKQSSAEGEGAKKQSSESGGSDGSAGSSEKKVSASAVVKRTLEQFSSLTARTPESVVGVHAQDEGWLVRLEVVESRRIPDSADLLAEYEVELDRDGHIVSYDRRDRYVRGRPSA